MLKVIVAVLGLGLAGLVAYVITRPDTFEVRRSIAVKAPPERIYAYIQDFRLWTQWSPFEDLDPDLKRIYSGQPSGQGAAYAWEGRKAGAGTMEILAAQSPEKVRIRLAFTKPIQAVNTAEFTLVPEGDQTEVTWVMHGPMSFVTKLMGLFYSMDDMVGGDFEKGLARLKARAEAEG